MSTRYWCILAALAALLTPPAQAQPAGAPTAQPSVAVPGFWDPRRRPERPDTSRISQIRFLTEFDYPPFNYAGPDGNPAGFNVELARLICEELKLQCTIQLRRFDTLLQALGENRADAVIASLAVTPETRLRVDFSDPYYRATARFVARRDSPLRDVMPEAIEGKKVAILPRTAHEQYLKAFFTEAELKTYPTMEAAREALRKGEVDLVFGDGIALAFWLNGTDFGQLLQIRRRPVHREPLFRRRRRHRGSPRQRHLAARLQLGAVPAVGKRPLHRSVAALFPDQPVLSRAFKGHYAPCNANG